MQNIDTTRLMKKRKEVIGNFETFLCKMNVLHDLNAHKILLSDIIETDKFNLRKSLQLTQQIPLKFTSLSNYVDFWQKVFQEETKSQIYAQIVKQGSEAQQVQILEIKDCQNQHSLGFKLFLLQQVTQIHQQKAIYHEGTLVILSLNKPQKNSNYPHLIGLVVQGQTLTIKAMPNQTVEKNQFQDLKLMSKTKKCYIQSICSVDSFKGQYYTLCNLSLISPNLIQIILQPQQHNKEMTKKFKIPQKLDSKLKTIFDKSQYSAINECLKQQGITLIHGPPSTGKTKTILGILSILLNSTKKTQQQTEASLLLNWKKYSQIQQKTHQLLNPWLYSNYTDWRDEPYIQNQNDPLNLTSIYHRCDTTDNRITLKKKNKVVQLPKKILICSTSNISLDQLITKLIKQKLINGNGKPFVPNLVRIGDSFNQQLKQYTLNILSQTALKNNKSSNILQSKQKILTEYELIFSPLSDIVNQQITYLNKKFDTIIIDNAQKSIQISTLTPLIYGCQRLILIGDPNLLSNKIFSINSQFHHYHQSLLERMMRAGYPFSTLTTQYRIHPTISAVIGQNFYKQQFNNWQHLMEEQPKATPSAFMIFHIKQSLQLYSKKSFGNKVQANAIKDFSNYLIKHYNDIGIISPYSDQVTLLHSILDKNKKLSIKGIDQLNYNGNEVILFSTVRSKMITRNSKIQQNNKKTIGFLDNYRIINTVIQKSTNLCVIFGDIYKLSESQLWKNLIIKSINLNQVYQYKIKQKKFIHSFQLHSMKYLIKSLS